MRVFGTKRNPAKGRWDSGVRFPSEMHDGRDSGTATTDLGTRPMTAEEWERYGPLVPRLVHSGQKGVSDVAERWTPERIGKLKEQFMALLTINPDMLSKDLAAALGCTEPMVYKRAGYCGTLQKLRREAREIVAAERETTPDPAPEPDLANPEPAPSPEFEATIRVIMGASVCDDCTHRAVCIIPDFMVDQQERLDEEFNALNLPGRLDHTRIEHKIAVLGCPAHKPACKACVD